MHYVFLIKCASSACNMKCRYCFYNDECDNRTIRNFGMMSDTTAHAIIDKALCGRRDTASFGFQGGEPTMSGLPFFKSFVSYLESKADSSRWSLSLQTNGLALDRDWAAFFRQKHFLIGLSLDGSKAVHDLYRLDHSGKGTFSRVFNNARMLQREGVEFNILTTVTKQAADSICALYDFYKRNSFRYLQFTACIDPIQSGRGENDYSLTPDSYAEFLTKLFRLYYRDWKRGQYTSIRYFDNLVSLMLTGRAEECGMNGVCGSYYVIEADGSVFPCDFYVLDSYCIGNINTDSLEEIEKKRKELSFVEKSKSAAPECLNCRWFRLCRGGCRRDRENFATGELEKTYLCEAYRQFFSQCINELTEIAEAEAMAIRRQQLMR